MLRDLLSLPRHATPVTIASPFEVPLKRSGLGLFVFQTGEKLLVPSDHGIFFSVFSFESPFMDVNIVLQLFPSLPPPELGSGISFFYHRALPFP